VEKAEKGKGREKKTPGYKEEVKCSAINAT